jgi:hypothetical protein
LQAQKGVPHRLGQPATRAQVLLDQVGDDFGVGLRVEAVAVGLQLDPQLAMVLHDAVVDHGHPVVARIMGMRIALGHSAVGGPARVAHGHVSTTEGAGVDQAADLADALGDHDGRGRAALDGHAPGVVAAVLQAFEPLDHEGRGVITRAGVGEDSTHRELPSSG